MSYFFEEVKKKQYEGTDHRCGLKDWNKIKDMISEESSALKRVHRAMMTKGTALNNPKISNSYIVQHGHRVETLNDIKKVLDKQ
jgi:hypothetical protein